jgi:antitoxin VapB
VNQTAKIIRDGQSQSVQLPEGFRFDEAEVFIRRDEKTGDVILSRAGPERDLSRFLSLIKDLDVPADFLVRDAIENVPSNRDPFADWKE